MFFSKSILLFLTLYLNFVAPIPKKDKSKVESNITLSPANNSIPKSYIEFGILNKQHHLYIGRCRPDDVKFHGENIILNNDGENHVNAEIVINVESKVNITCVNILDQIPNGEGAYPSFVAGGVGHDYVEFAIKTPYGKGFNFYVEIYGYYL